jgi:hypothetical protein
MTRDEFLNLKPGDQIGLKGVTYQVVGWFQQSPTLRVATTGKAARLVLREDGNEVAEAVRLRPGDSMYADTPRCVPVINQSGETIAVLADPTPGQVSQASLSQIVGQGYVLRTAECPRCCADAYIVADSKSRGPETTVVYYGCLSCSYEDSDVLD